MSRTLSPTAAPVGIPFVDGQPISRRDFYHITEADPDRYRRTERIDGRVVMNAASVRREGHGKPNAIIAGMLFNYAAETPGTEVGDNSTAQIADAHDPQPDAYLLVLPGYGGQVTFTDDDYIRGAPELIVEVAGRSLQEDLGRKKAIYESDGCREYLVWATDRQRFYCFRNSPTGFVEEDVEDGVFRSQTFPGLWLDTAALLRDDLSAALATLRDGLATAEHGAYVRQLADRRDGAD